MPVHLGIPGHGGSHKGLQHGKRGTITEEELVGILENELSAASGFDSGELAAVRERAIRYYYNEPTGSEVAGRSQVQSTDLADMVEAVVAQMMPAFSSDAPAHFEPNAEEDEDQAALESSFVNDQIMAANEGYVIIQEGVKDALLQMNGIIKVWVDQIEHIKKHTVRGVDAEGLIMALIPESASEEVELVSQDEISPGVWDLTITRTNIERKLRLRAVAPENWRFQQDWNRITLGEIRFCAEREYRTRSSLVEAGYDDDIVYALAPTTNFSSGQQQARHGGNASGELGGQEPSTEVIEVWTCYLLVDQDGDGVAERHLVVFAGTDGAGNGGTILDNVETEGVPYAAGVAILRPHEFNGISLFEKLKQTQDIKTDALRQWLDNMRSMNNRRIGYRSGAVDLVSLFTSKPGGGIECRDPHADLNPIPTDDIGPSILQLLGYMDGVRTEQAGASLDFIDAEAQIAGTSGVAIEGQYARKEMLAAMMTRNIAETLIKETYLLVHRTMRVHLVEPLQMRTGSGEWVQSTPAEWAPRARVAVKAGLSMGERLQKKTALEQVIAVQKDALQSGLSGQLTDAPRLYQAVIDWGYAAMLDNPEQYWIDPKSEAAQQAAQAQQEQTQQQASAMTELQQGLAQMQVTFEKYKVDEELRFKYWEQQQETEIEEAKLIQKDTSDENDNRTTVAVELVKQRGADRGTARPPNGR